MGNSCCKGYATEDFEFKQESLPPRARPTEDKKVQDFIVVKPSQFVMENASAIKGGYKMERKLGEGKREC